MATVLERDKSDFEMLLHMAERERNNLIRERDTVEDYVYPAERHKAKCGASLTDLVRMIAELVSKGMKESGATLNPDEGARIRIDQEKKISNPVILYRVISSSPKGEMKPRVREDIMERTDDENSRRPGRIFGQRFECTVQFDIMAPDYLGADKAMEEFENLVFNYTSYLKDNGIAEIMLKRHFTDSNTDIYRQSLSVRSLQYYVEIEKLFVKFGGVFDTMAVSGEPASDTTEYF